MIKWNVFFENSSTTDALAEFVDGDISLNQLKKDCWPAECKKEINRLLYRIRWETKFDVKKARNLAKRALQRNGCL